MKIIICLTAIFSTCFYMKGNTQELKSEFLFDLGINLDAPQTIGQGLRGTRIIFPFQNGFVKGNKINGKISSCSAEWGLIADSTTFKVDVRATIETSDGALIYMTYTGYNHADEKKFAMINAGRANELSPSDYYFRTALTFETGSPKYAWLNYTVAVGIGSLPESGKVFYRVYAIK
jgi:hypothetical protein